MSLATRIGEEFNLVRDEGMARLNALCPYNGIIGTDTKQQQENLVFSTTVGNEYKILDTIRFRKIDGKVIDTYGPELVTNGDFNDGTTGWYGTANATLSVVNNVGRLTNTAAWGISKYSITVTIGKTYLVRANITSTLNSYIDVVGRGTVLYAGEAKTFIATASIQEIRIVNNVGSAGDYTDFDNISVKEVQTIDFSRSGQHPFEVYTNTALTSPNNVLAGDYVVVDTPELVTNGTFDTDTSGWTIGTGAAASVISGEVKVTSGAILGIYQELSGLIIGQTYTITGIGRIQSVGEIMIRYYPETFNSGTAVDSNIVTSTSNQFMSITFVAASSSPVIYLRVSDVGYFDNISVKLVDDTYRATRDSSEMYDYATEPTTSYPLVAGDVVLYNNGTAVAGVKGHYYKINTNVTASVGSMNFTAAAWTDLGTSATMSLQNPYFETRNYISNQVLAMQKADGTIHTETLFKDAYAVETTNAILASNGWSKLENGLYSKGAIVASPIGYAQC